MPMRSWLTLALLLCLSMAGAAYPAEPPRAPSGPFAVDATDERAMRALFPADLFARTELFFGSLKPDGSMVSEEAFLTFLDEHITPRFPNGLTLLTGLGQFLTSQGVIIQEQSRLLILLYPVEERRANSEKVEQIRTEYKEAFEQESVLRADRCCEWVGF
jgi:Protein of unknown function (DUF3574)